jgi:hypothetical protein
LNKSVEDQCLSHLVIMQCDHIYFIIRQYIHTALVASSGDKKNLHALSF